MTIDWTFMVPMFDLCRKKGIKTPPPELFDDLCKQADSLLPKKMLPQKGESLAVSIYSPKVAALAHDKIFRIPLFCDDVPDELSYCFESITEKMVLVSALILHYSAVGAFLLPESREALKSNTICTDFMVQRMLQLIDHKPWTFPTAYYTSHAAYEKEFPIGPQQVLTAAFENLKIVDESALSWKQVLAFREDKEARANYRRLVCWIDDELTSKSKSPKIVQEMIAIRLYDYEKGLKKHGIQTVLGNLSCVLDPRFLTAASAVAGATALAKGEPWAALCGAVTIGCAAVKFTKSYIDSQAELCNAHGIAYIHEIKKIAE